MRPRYGLQISTLLIVGLISLIVCWLGMRWWVSGTRSVADPGWLGLAVMVAVGATVLVAGSQVRRFRDGVSEVAISPLRAARTLVLGQAAALTGAALAGWYTANILVLLPDADVASQLARVWPLLAHAIVAIGLAVAGMIVQRWCRVRPRSDDGEHDEEPPTY